MKKMSVALAVSLLSLAGTAAAQSTGVTMSTDPAKAADIEQRAQMLQDAQDKQSAMKMEMPGHKAKHPHHGAKASGASAAQ
ncbi:hypothetical protein [Pararobbsia alpina]|uniref:Uncharacterized protein n=1 Tax=Pararobbsia alpina TaxID=621374 RepID=A0A6S7B474_9BURK|nr:hypothetical protein [Pararobbsia alpina]CAB3784962.1 hypothetical protein LMG28138_01916 [Pararobbsia alpina]